MSAVETSRKPSNRYVEYLHMYQRRLRKAAADPPCDGAGLLGGSRYHGRETPLKGKGTPPADDLETPVMEGGIKMVPGKWCTQSHVFNTHTVPIGVEDLAFRPSIRQFKTAFASSMVGSGAVVVEEVSGRAVETDHLPGPTHQAHRAWQGLATC